MGAIEDVGTLKADARTVVETVDGRPAEMPDDSASVIERNTVKLPAVCRARAVPWCSWRRVLYVTSQEGAVQFGVRDAFKPLAHSAGTKPAGRLVTPRSSVGCALALYLTEGDSDCMSHL